MIFFEMTIHFIVDFQKFNILSSFYLFFIYLQKCGFFLFSCGIIAIHSVFMYIFFVIFFDYLIISYIFFIIVRYFSYDTCPLPSSIHSSLELWM